MSADAPLPREAVFSHGATSSSGWPTDEEPQIAFLGRSNAGKSSLLNALLGRTGLVRTSRIPGRTREINFFRIRPRGWFVDLPGLGYARGDHAGELAGLVSLYLDQTAQPRLLVYLVDASVPDARTDRICLPRLLDAGVPILVVLAKADRLGQSECVRNPRIVREIYGLPESPPLVSARTGTGLTELGQRLADVLDAP